jgi:hypothetical protein
LTTTAPAPGPLAELAGDTLVGKFARSESRAVAALKVSHVDDPSPAVRENAGWSFPGGPSTNGPCRPRPDSGAAISRISRPDGASGSRSRRSMGSVRVANGPLAVGDVGLRHVDGLRQAGEREAHDEEVGDSHRGDTDFGLRRRGDGSTDDAAE